MFESMEVFIIFIVEDHENRHFENDHIQNRDLDHIEYLHQHDHIQDHFHLNHN